MKGYKTGCTECDKMNYKKGGQKKQWMKKATKNMRKDKPCSGNKFGGPTCPPGSKRYNLAKVFRKLAEKRKKEMGGSAGMNELDIGKNNINYFKKALQANAQMYNQDLAMQNAIQQDMQPEQYAVGGTYYDKNIFGFDPSATNVGQWQKAYGQTTNPDYTIGDFAAELGSVYDQGVYNMNTNPILTDGMTKTKTTLDRKNLRKDIKSDDVNLSAAAQAFKDSYKEDQKNNRKAARSIFFDKMNPFTPNPEKPIFSVKTGGNINNETMNYYNTGGSTSQNQLANALMQESGMSKDQLINRAQNDPGWWEQFVSGFTSAFNVTREDVQNALSTIATVAGDVATQGAAVATYPNRAMINTITDEPGSTNFTSFGTTQPTQVQKRYGGVPNFGPGGESEPTYWEKIKQLGTQYNNFVKDGLNTVNEYVTPLVKEGLKRGIDPTGLYENVYNYLTGPDDAPNELPSSPTLVTNPDSKRMLDPNRGNQKPIPPHILQQLNPEDRQKYFDLVNQGLIDTNSNPNVYIGKPGSPTEEIKGIKAEPQGVTKMQPVKNNDNSENNRMENITGDQEVYEDTYNVEEDSQGYGSGDDALGGGGPPFMTYGGAYELGPQSVPMMEHGGTHDSDNVPTSDLHSIDDPYSGLRGPLSDYEKRGNFWYYIGDNPNWENLATVSKGDKSNMMVNEKNYGRLEALKANNLDIEPNYAGPDELVGAYNLDGTVNVDNPNGIGSAIGTTGAPGVNGPQGSPGNQGIQGPTGPTGPQGTADNSGAGTYNLLGQRVDNPTEPGTYLVKDENGKAKKLVIGDNGQVIGDDPRVASNTNNNKGNNKGNNSGGNNKRNTNVTNNASNSSVTNEVANTEKLLNPSSDGSGSNSSSAANIANESTENVDNTSGERKGNYVEPNAGTNTDGSQNQQNNLFTPGPQYGWAGAPIATGNNLMPGYRTKNNYVPGGYGLAPIAYNAEKTYLDDAKISSKRGVFGKTKNKSHFKFSHGFDPQAINNPGGGNPPPPPPTKEEEKEKLNTTDEFLQTNPVTGEQVSVKTGFKFNEKGELVPTAYSGDDAETGDQSTDPSNQTEEQSSDDQDLAGTNTNKGNPDGSGPAAITDSEMFPVEVAQEVEGNNRSWDEKASQKLEDEYNVELMDESGNVELAEEQLSDEEIGNQIKQEITNDAELQAETDNEQPVIEQLDEIVEEQNNPNTTGNNQNILSSGSADSSGDEINDMMNEVNPYPKGSLEWNDWEQENSMSDDDSPMGAPPAMVPEKEVDEENTVVLDMYDKDGTGNMSNEEMMAQVAPKRHGGSHNTIKRRMTGYTYGTGGQKKDYYNMGGNTPGDVNLKDLHQEMKMLEARKAEISGLMNNAKFGNGQAELPTAMTGYEVKAGKLSYKYGGPKGEDAYLARRDAAIKASMGQQKMSHGGGHYPDGSPIDNLTDQNYQWHGMDPYKYPAKFGVDPMTGDSINETYDKAALDAWVNKNRLQVTEDYLRQWNIDNNPQKHGGTHYDKYQEGGEYYLSDDEVQAILDAGGQIEYID